jgi:hypothetical protein
VGAWVGDQQKQVEAFFHVSFDGAEGNAGSERGKEVSVRRPKADETGLGPEAWGLCPLGFRLGIGFGHQILLNRRIFASWRLGRLRVSSRDKEGFQQCYVNQCVSHDGRLLF